MEKRGQPWLLLPRNRLPCLTQDLRFLNYTRLAGQWTPEIHLPPPPQCWDYKLVSLCTALSHGLKGLNSCCKASTLPAEPSDQDLDMTLFYPPWLVFWKSDQPCCLLGLKAFLRMKDLPSLELLKTILESVSSRGSHPIPNQYHWLIHSCWWEM